MKKILSTFLLLPLIACANVSVDEPSVCDSANLGTFPGSPIVVRNPPSVSYSTQENFSDTLHKISQVTDSYSVSVTELTLTSPSDLSWVRTLQVSMSANGGTSVPFATYDSATSGAQQQGSLNLTIQMDAATLTTYLKSPVQLTFVVSGAQTPTATTNLSANFCIAANGSVTKSL